jgi:hypothetical protein
MTVVPDAQTAGPQGSWALAEADRRLAGVGRWHGPWVGS